MDCPGVASTENEPRTVTGRAVSLFASALLIMACGGDGPSEPSGGDPGQSGERILFARDSLGVRSLASVRPDGSDLRFIRGPVAESFPNFRVSRDQSRIAVVAGRNIRVLDAGGDVVGETTWPDGAWFDDLSPDGRRLLWSRFDEAGSAYEIYTTAPDGSDVQSIRTFSEAAYSLVKASRFLSSGSTTRIVFVGVTSDFGAEIYSMAPDGDDLRRLTDTDDGKDSPVPSPDGGQIAYVTFRTLESVGAQGGASRQLMSTADFQAESHVEEVAWSWDGSTIVAYVESSNPGFWVVSREGGDARRITEGGPFHSGYAVSPNGRRLVYADVDEDLVIVDVDTGERDLFLGMTEPIDEASPVWLPE